MRSASRRDGEREQREREGHRQARADLGADGARADVRIAEVAAEQLPRPRRELLSSGWSEPTWARAAAICSWVASIDSRAFAGSPGSSRRPE